MLLHLSTRVSFGVPMVEISCHAVWLAQGGPPNPADKWLTSKSWNEVQLQWFFFCLPEKKQKACRNPGVAFSPGCARFWPCHRCQLSRVSMPSLPPMTGHPELKNFWRSMMLDFLQRKVWRVIIFGGFVYSQIYQATHCNWTLPSGKLDGLPGVRTKQHMRVAQVKGFQRIYDAPEADKEGAGAKRPTSSAVDSTGGFLFWLYIS